MDFNVSINPEENVVPRTVTKPVYNMNDIDGIFHTLDEGILDLATVKDISMGSRNQDYNQDILAAGRRYGLTHVESCVSILYGTSLNENRILCILCPPMLARQVNFSPKRIQTHKLHHTNKYTRRLVWSSHYMSIISVLTLDYGMLV